MGLARSNMPFRDFFMALLISPLIVPIVIAAAGMYFFYSSVGLAQTTLGLIFAHTSLGVPFVVITMTATLSGFDQSLVKAASSLGANPITTFYRVTLPLVAPGMISGALFAFATSFDEVTVVLFLGGPGQTTLPRQMWIGLREQLSPTILSAAFMLIIVVTSMLLLVTLRRHRCIRHDGITR
jgi:putative spermidine/putrescine transport system permease protein